MQENNTYRAGLYLRLSKDDDIDGESISIGTQRAILLDYCDSMNYEVCKIYVDATDIIGLKQNPTYGRRFSPIFLFIRAFCGAKRKMLL